MLNLFCKGFLGIILLSLLASCASTKSAIYFDNIQDSVMQVQVENLEPVIQKSDLLNISVSSSNPELTQIFNVSNAGSQTGGYLVEEDGTIQFPLLGTIKAAGISKRKLQETIKSSLISKKLLLDPIVDVRFVNFKVYIMGEVARPSMLSVPNEKINLLQAISMAGDLTNTAKRNNVLLIREEEGRKIFKRLNLTSPDLFESPYYNLKSNDIIYVEPTKTKISRDSRFNQIFPVVVSCISLGFLVVDKVVK